MGKMHSNLMHSSCCRIYFYQGKIVPGFYCFIMSECIASFIGNADSSGIFVTACKIGLYFSFFGLGNSCSNSKIGLFNLSSGKHIGKLCLGKIIFSYYNQSRSTSIQAMNNSRTVKFFSAGKVFSKAIKNGIHQSSFGISKTWMHNHSCFFIDNSEVFIFINHIQGYILRQNIHRFRLGKIDNNFISFLKKIAFFYGSKINQNTLFFYEVFNKSAGIKFLYLQFRQKLIQALHFL